MFAITTAVGGCAASPSRSSPSTTRSFILGRPADRLDRFQHGARLLRALARQAPADPGLDRDHREGVRDHAHA
jgi:hypothetical protein